MKASLNEGEAIAKEGEPANVDEACFKAELNEG